MATLKDIATELNVSKSLVSKVLTNRMGTTCVTPQLAEAIRKKAKELNYQKNASAFSLTTGRHNTIGVFIHRYGEIGSGLLERLMLGIAGKAGEYDQKTMLSFFETSAEFNKAINLMHTNVVDGLIVGGLPHNELADKVCEISKNGLPVITIQENPMHPNIPNVAVDEEATGYVATRHLIEKGCRNIGHIRTPEYESSRYMGYCRALREAGLKIDSSRIFMAKDLGFSLAAGDAFARKILQDGIPLDGLVAESDHQALGAMNTFQTAGIKIPDEIKIIGVDNSPFCRFQSVQISSVSHKTMTKGRLAVEMLMRLKEGEKVDNVMLDPVLKIRRSSGGE
jgi:LacI family transcriptional regulator